ncbi:unnamed protein product [Gongylonema pulchrum]|uniref:deoxyribose-phosphate aldolase n=1 Tax=Gongylonema pulchrum TaxID=637853 RepID=A0A183EGN3_9BILA|nr:unnamed protein product [Gongylonema pulchrum]
MPENELDEEEFNKVISEKYYVDSNKKRDLLNLIPYIDLTTLNGDDTNAVNPSLKCASICVYPARIANAKCYLFSKGKNLPVSAALEVKLAIADGADEIDVVISRDAALEQDWRRE